MAYDHKVTGAQLAKMCQVYTEEYEIIGTQLVK